MNKSKILSSYLKPKKTKRQSLAKLKKKLWTFISLKVRKEEPNCVTCGRPTTDAGHFIKKSVCNLVYKYMIENIHGQCKRCNIFLDGNYVEYRKFMIKKYGETIVNLMELEYNKTLPIYFNPRIFIEEQIKFYSNT